MNERASSERSTSSDFATHLTRSETAATCSEATAAAAEFGRGRERERRVHRHFALCGGPNADILCCWVI